jgi:hypothetical protein
MRIRRVLVGISIALLPVLLVACPEKKAPIVDAAPVVTAEPPEAAPLVPMLDDAGDDADSGDSGKKPTGPYVDPKVARIKQCCAALRRQGATAPELMIAATQCDAIAAQAGAKGTAPELGFLRSIKSVPAVCAGL